MWSKNARYLDYNAGSGLHPRVSEQLAQLLGDPEFFAANPSSRHRLGQKMQHLLYKAALRIAKSFGTSSDSVTPDHLLFTSSGTEASQTVLRSFLSRGIPVFVGAGEHSASHDFTFAPPARPEPVAEIPLLPNGQYDLGGIYNHLDRMQSPGEKEREPQSLLLSLFYANNETGVLTDLEVLSRARTELQARLPGVQILIHLDGAQVWGKLPLNLPATPADYVTFSSHKIGAPAGTGVIWSRKPIAESGLEALIVGTQAHGLRGGTENWLGIHATGLAAELSCQPDTIAQFQSRTRDLQARLERGLAASGIPTTIWGAGSPRISNTTRFSLDDFTSYENWVELLDLRGFAVSHGSACKSQVIEPSRVLLKMGATRAQALNSIRVSFGPDSTEADVDELLAQLRELYHNKKKS